MDAEGNGPSMQGLAQKLEALTERLGGLERENAGLRQEVATLKGAATHKEELAARKASEGPSGQGAARLSSGSEEAVSRRAMLSKAGAAAVAALAAGTLLSPRRAEAADGNFDRVYTKYLQADGGSNIAVYATGTTNSSFDGVIASDNRGAGPGVQGFSRTGDGVTGETGGAGKSGVYGQHDGTSGYGVIGDGKGADGAGVLGRNDGGTGIKGEGKNGVVGESSTDDWAALYGNHKGASGPGVMGDGKGSVYPGVLGRNPSGYGGLFEGGKAQLKLTPKGSVGRPRSGSHQKGEIYLDSAATLFVCTQAGTPGTWRRVTTTAAS